MLKAWLKVSNLNFTHHQTLVVGWKRLLAGDIGLKPPPIAQPTPPRVFIPAVAVLDAVVVDINAG